MEDTPNRPRSFSQSCRDSIVNCRELEIPDAPELLADWLTQVVSTACDVAMPRRDCARTESQGCQI